MAGEQKRIALKWAIAAAVLNGGCLLVLFANLIGGNPWGMGAVITAAVLLVAGGVVGFQARRLWIRGRSSLD